MQTTRTYSIFSTLTLVALSTCAFTVSALETQLAEPSIVTEENEVREEPTSTSSRQDVRPSRSGVFGVRDQDRIINLGSNIQNRLIAALDRLENIAGRLDTRIQKLKTLGIDTTSAERTLLDAKNKLAEARTRLTSIDSLEVAARSNTPRESFARVREEFLATRENIRTAHTLLQSTITLLKDGTSVATTEKDIPPTTPDETIKAE